MGKTGVFQARKKDNTVYYRSSITYKGKHISLGSFPTEEDASAAYEEAVMLLRSQLSLEQTFSHSYHLPFAKIVSSSITGIMAFIFAIPSTCRRNFSTIIWMKKHH